jgi:hypothetical protein
VTIGTVEVGVSVIVAVGVNVKVAVGDGSKVGVSVTPVTGMSTITRDVAEASGPTGTVGGIPAGKLQARVAANSMLKTGKSFLVIMGFSFLIGLTIQRDPLPKSNHRDLTNFDGFNTLKSGFVSRNPR